MQVHGARLIVQAISKVNRNQEEEIQNFFSRYAALVGSPDARINL